MKVAFFDCFSGISGDMVLGALVDLGIELGFLESELASLGLEGYKIRHDKAVRRGISGSKVKVEDTARRTERSYKDIVGLIEESRLSSGVKTTSLKIFKNLAIVEGKIHGMDHEEVSFHEIGGTDSIIDIVGTAVSLEKLGIERVYSSKVHVGRGFVECGHGKLPVPAPATLELLEGIPVYSTGIEGELVTPTGAAILKSVSRGFGNMPEMKIGRVGYGAGDKDYNIPNLLRVVIGEASISGYDADRVFLVETNIDDMNPEFFGHIFSLLEKEGCLDVFMTPVYMKKNRPATLLSVLAGPEKLDDILSVIFSETTSIGVRIREVERRKLSRQKISVMTEFGEIEVKVGRMDGEIKNIAPEYESCRKIALEKRVPLKDVYDAAKKADMPVK
ncbi:MAG: nickel pincer cofactor biosynthesis protein LarC [Candidatus Omnitrophota bacterium]